jgi:hypothetical protein
MTYSLILRMIYLLQQQTIKSDTEISGHDYV